MCGGYVHTLAWCKVCVCVRACACVCVYMHVCMQYRAVSMATNQAPLFVTQCMMTQPPPPHTHTPLTDHWRFPVSIHFIIPVHQIHKHTQLPHPTLIVQGNPKSTFQIQPIHSCSSTTWETYQSSGLLDSGSGMNSGPSSNHPSGFSTSMSGTLAGASSSLQWRG